MHPIASCTEGSKISVRFLLWMMKYIAIKVSSLYPPVNILCIYSPSTWFRTIFQPLAENINDR